MQNKYFISQPAAIITPARERPIGACRALAGVSSGLTRSPISYATEEFNALVPILVISFPLHKRHSWSSDFSTFIIFDTLFIAFHLRRLKGDFTR